MTSIKAIDQQLEGVGIIEKDDHNDIIMTWYVKDSSKAQLFGNFADQNICRSHPVLQPAGITQVAISRAMLDRLANNIQFSFSKFGSSWLYLLSTENSKESPALSRVTAFCIVLVTKVFNPEKYASLAKILADTYNTHGTPVKVLEDWLTAIRGAPLGDYEPTSFPKSQAMLATNLKGMAFTIFTYR